MADPVIDRIYSMTATQDANIFSLDLGVIIEGVKERTPFIYNRDDPYGLGPLIKEHLVGKKIKIAPYSAPDVVEAAYRIEKTLIWQRMDEDEADIMEQSLMTASAKERQMYAAAQYLNSGDPLWVFIQQKLTAAFSAQRAEELLAKE